MPTLAHAVPEVSQNQLSRRQARAVRVLRHFREIEMGLHLSEMRAERVELSKLLRLAAISGDVAEYCKLVDAMATLRGDALRLAQVPMPPRGRHPVATRSMVLADLDPVMIDEAPIDGVLGPS